MRIAFIVGRFPVISETFILNQIAGLIDKGNDVDIYAFQGKPIEQTDKVHPIVERYQLLDRTHYPAKNAENYIDSVVETHASMFEGKKPYDIIHCQFGPFGVMAMRLRQAGIIEGKLITNFRGFDISRHLQEYGEDIYEELFKQGDLFLANCEFFRQRAIKLGCAPHKILVHGSGIDCDKFTFTPRYLPDDRIVRVATVGRFVEKKGLEYAIRAIAKVVQKYPKLEYHLIGDGHLREQFENLIKELEIEPFVILHGWKEQREIVEILDRCQLFVAPSVTAPDGNQDAPVNTLKEAMAIGLPVIGTLHGGIPELVEEAISGFLVPEKDSESIASKLSYLIEHPQLWPDMGKAGRDRVKEKYNMNMLNKELYELYQKLTRSKQLIA